jgi:hypothetical protein
MSADRFEEAVRDGRYRGYSQASGWMRVLVVWTGRILLGVLAAGALVYVSDYSLYLLRGHPLDQVEVTRYMTAPLKSGGLGNKTEYFYEGTGPLSCSKSLFPQDGWSPCWYLRRHKLYAEKA